jgi:hypothetical protein
MNKKPTAKNTKSERSKPVTKRRFYRSRYFVFGLPAVIVLLAVGGFAIWQNAHRPQTKTQAYQNLQNISARMNFPGTLVYEKITDQGCGPNPTTWLSLKDICTVSLDKFYKASGSAVDNMKLADSTITGMGWQLWHNDPGSRTDFERRVRERGGLGIVL